MSIKRLLSGIDDAGEIAGNFTDGDATTRTRGPIFKLASSTAAPTMFDPGVGYVAQSWGIANNGWIHGYVELAQQPTSSPDGASDASSRDGG